MSLVESSPPYEPSQPATASISTDIQHCTAIDVSGRARYRLDVIPIPLLAGMMGSSSCLNAQLQQFSATIKDFPRSNAQSLARKCIVADGIYIEEISCIYVAVC